MPRSTPKERQPGRAADEDGPHEMVGRKDDDGAGDRHDHGCGQMAPGEQDQGDEPDRHDRREGDHRRDRGERAKQDRMRRAGEEIDDAEQHALADAHEHKAVHRAVDRGDHLFADALAARAEQLFGDDEALPQNAVAVAKQEEQREQTENEDEDAMQNLGAESAADLAVRGGVDLMQRLRRPAGVGEMRVPPIGRGLRSIRQMREDLGRRNAGQFDLAAIIDGVVELPHGFEREGDEGQQERDADEQGEGERQQLVSEPEREARARAAVERPERDGENDRPRQRRKVVPQDINAEAEQDDGKQAAPKRLPARRRALGRPRARRRTTLA